MMEIQEIESIILSSISHEVYRYPL